MRLLSLYIDNFGKLSDFSMELSEGLNSVYAENGYGKTTLAAFIKAMLYGLPKSTKKSVIENERKHYLPWGGGAFGGYLDIETQKGIYRIERSFGKKETDDTFTLRDLKTGLVSVDYSENIGVEIFGIDMTSYEKSIYLPQKTVEITMSSDIGAKLNKMLESSADMADCDSALRRLDDYMRNLRLKKGSGGVINDLQMSLAECEERAYACRAALELAEKERQELEPIRAQIRECREREESMRDETGRANAAIIKAEEYKTYLEYAKDAEVARQRAEEIRELFPDSALPKKEELAAAHQLCRRLDRIEHSDPPSLSLSEQTVLETHEARFSEHVPSNDELAAYAGDIASLRERQSEYVKRELPLKPAERHEKKPSYKIYTVFTAIAGLGCVTSAILNIVLNNPAFIATLAVCAFACVSLIAARVVSGFKYKARLKQNADEFESELANYEKALCELDEEEKAIAEESQRLENELSKYYPSCPGGLDACLARLSADCESYSNLLLASERVSAALAKRNGEIALMRDTLSDFLVKYNVDPSDPEEALSEIARRTAELSARTDEWLTKRRRASEYAKEREIDPENPPVVPDTEDLRRESAELHEQINRLCADEGARLSRIESLEEKGEELAEITHEIDSVRAKIAESEMKHASAKSAYELLQKARDSLSSRYIRQMEQSFERNSEMFETVMGEASIDVKLGISFRDGGHARDPEWYSEGMQSIIYLCLRLALTDALFEKESPFMILDDPFSELDDERLEKAKEIVRALANERQIIYLTCYSKRNIG